MKEEALDRTMWMNRFGRGFGPLLRQNNEWMKYQIYDARLYSASVIVFKLATL